MRGFAISAIRSDAGVYGRAEQIIPGSSGILHIASVNTPPCVVNIDGAVCGCRRLREPSSHACDADYIPVCGSGSHVSLHGLFGLESLYFFCESLNVSNIEI